MTTNNQENGFTKVWEGNAKEFIDIIFTWSIVPRDLLQTGQGTGTTGSIALYVANEAIDWKHFRDELAYRPLNINSPQTRGITTDKILQQACEQDVLKKLRKQKSVY